MTELEMTEPEYEEEEEKEEKPQSFLVSFMYCLLVLGVLVGAFAVVLDPKYRPKELEELLRPVDELIFDYQELLHNYLNADDNPKEELEPKFDWEQEEKKIKEQLVRLDEEIENLTNELAAVKKEKKTLSDTRFGKFAENLYVLSSLTLLQPLKIRNEINEIAKKGAQCEHYAYLLSEARKPSAEGQSSTLQAKQAKANREVTEADRANLVELDKLKFDNSIDMQNFAKLLAMYAKKWKQLKWIYGINRPSAIYDQVTATFNSLLGVVEDPESGAPKEIDTSRGAKFLKLARNSSNQLFSNIDIVVDNLRNGQESRTKDDSIKGT